MDREKQVLQRNLELVKKALVNLEQLKVVTQNFISSSKIRDLYRGLIMGKSRVTATKLVVHTENIVSELESLESVLRDAEAILLQQAEHYDDKNPTASR